MRLAKIDTLRGINLISMMLYHAVWDMVYIFNADIPWYNGAAGYIWQQSICWTFILLSGFSWRLGKHHVKRGITVFLCGAAVTAVTVIFMPEDVVWFGILTFMGSAMLIMILWDKLFGIGGTAAGTASMLCGAALFVLTRHVGSGILGYAGLGLTPFISGFSVMLPKDIYAGYLTAFLGFPPGSFFSTDYFPLIPWFFLYAVGYGIYGVLPMDRGSFTKVLEKGVSAPFEFIGRHTLIIYMLHQPLIYGALYLINKEL